MLFPTPDKIAKVVHLLMYPIIAASALYFSMLVEQNNFTSALDHQRNGLRSVANEIRTELDHELLSKMLMAQGLSSVLSVEPNLGQEQFSELAESLRQKDTSIINIAALKDFTIIRVYPLEDNKGILGADIRNADRQSEIAQIAIQFQTPVVDGPIDLLQGGRGFIVRAPVFLDNGGFWGFSSIVVDEEDFYQNAGLNIDRPGVDFAIRHIHPDGTQDPPFWGNASLFNQEPVREMLERPTGSWEIVVVPKNGWITRSDSLWANRLFFLALAVFIGTIYHFLRKQRVLAVKAHDRLNDAIESLPAGFVVYDENGYLTGYNQAFCEMYDKCAPAVRLGATSDEIMQYGLEQGQFPDAIGREEEWLKELRDSLKIDGFTWEYPLSNGRWVKSYNQTTREGGRVGVRLDVTELRQQQAELETANHELQSALSTRDAAEQRFADIANISTDWFWEQDSEGRFTYLSEGFTRATGVAVAEMLGKTRAEAFQHDKLAQESGDWKYLEKFTAKHLPFTDFIYSMSGNKGKGVSLRITGLPYYDQQGDFAGYRGVGSDVSILTNALRKAEASNHAKSEFLSVINHELRTPLTVILGFNAFLKKPDILRSVVDLRKYLKQNVPDQNTSASLVDAVTSEIATYAEKLDISGQQLLRIIDRILALSSIESGNENIALAEIDISDFMSDVVNDFDKAVKKKDLNLSFEVHHDKILADRVRLKQILGNLIGNAIKFTDQGTIHVTSKRVGHDIQIQVQDTGQGIPEELQEAIFDSFQQAEKAGIRREGGVGLGLTIVKKLVEMHGGSIRLESKLREGTTFTLTFPAANGTATAA